MTAEELRVEVARLVGWKHIQRCTRHLKPREDGVEWRGEDPNGDHTGGCTEHRLLPHYDTSLDAAHEACRALLVTHELADAFLHELQDIRVTSAIRAGGGPFGIYPFFATAAEICQALVATLGKGDA